MVNAQSGTSTIKQISFSASTADIPTNGLKLWLNAQSGVAVPQGDNVVNSWTDQSLNVNSASPVSSNKPRFYTNVVGGKPVVEFFWSGNTEMQGPISLGTQTSIFAVSAVTGYNTGSGCPCPTYEMQILSKDNYLFFGNDNSGNFATLSATEPLTMTQLAIH